MAKNTQEAEVIVTMNGQAAKNEIKTMKQQLEEFSKELLRLQKTPVSAMKPGEVQKMGELMKETKKLEKQIKSAEDKTEAFARTLKNINSSSLKDLQAAARRLSFEVKELKPGTQAFIEKSQQLQQVNTRIVQLRTSFKGLVAEEKAATISLKGLADGFNRYFGMLTAGIAALTGVSMALKKCAMDAAALDDSYATVMKTTGLTHEEVEQLNEAFKQMDTRTAREELNKMAYEAGKLGYTGVENIRQFVEAADIINVALGDVLGEGATLEIAKLAQVFSKSTEALDNLDLKGRMLAVGSAVNQLGKDSTASESYMVEFLGRLGGVAVQAGLSADQILGFASALDQTKQKVEMSATAFQKLIQQMIKKPEEFLDAVQMPLEEFKKLMETDMNGAILKVLRGFQDMGGFLEQVPMFREMGLDGARAAGVMSSLAGNLELVARAQSVANEHIHLGTSMTREYNIMNSSMQAQLEKARKEFKDICAELGQKLNPIMLKSTKATTYLIKAFASYGKEIRNVAIAIGVLTLAIKAKTIAQKAFNVVVKAGNALQATWTVVTKAASYAINTLRGRTIAATKAYIAMNAAMNASVFGVIALAVAGLTAAITHWVKKSREANEVMDRMEEIQNRMTEEFNEEASTVKTLNDIVHNNKIEIDERRKALEKLKSIIPEYHADLTKEGVLINDNTEALKEYLKNLEKATRAKIYEEEYRKATKEVMDAETAKKKAEKDKSDALEAAGGDDTEYNLVVGYGLSSRMRKNNTPYGDAVQADVEATNNLNDALAKQAEIREKWESEMGVTTIDLTEEGREIRKVTDRYKELFNEIKDQYRDNPDAGKERLDQLREEQQKEIAEIHKKYAEKKTVEDDLLKKNNTILSEAQFEYLQIRQDKLTKKEQEMVAKKYEDLTEDDSKALKARYDKLIAADIKAEDKRYQEQVKQLQREQKAAENDLLKKFLHGEDGMTYKDYQERLMQIQKSFLKERLLLAKQEGKDTSEIEAQLLQLRSEKVKQSFNDLLDELNECYADEQRALKMSLTAQEITQDEYDSQMLESKVRYLKDKLELAAEYGQDEKDIMKAYEEAIKESQDLAFEQMEKLKKQAKDVTDELHPKEARAKKENLELKELQMLYDLKLITEEDFQKRKRNIIKKYNKENLDDDLGNIKDYASKANSIMEQAANFVNALRENASAKLEAQYQADLTAAGDNAEKREQIEAEYEQKKLDLQKKYADVDMAINIAKAVAAGALAAVEAFAAAGGNPVLGAVFAALIAMTTAVEVASIVAQRNAIKNMSVNNSGSSSAKTGKRTVNGYAEGGYTEDHTTLTTVGEKGREWVGPAWMVRQNPVMFANLERYRKTGSHGRSGSISKGFAEGGFTASNPAQAGSVDAAFNMSDLEAAVEAAIRRTMADGAIRAFVVRKDITELDNQTNRFKSMTSRG